MVCYFDDLSDHKINPELSAKEQVKPNMCLSLPYIEHGHLSQDMNSAEITCDEGYRFRDGRKSVELLCEEGEWNPRDIQCMGK